MDWIEEKAEKLKEYLKNTGLVRSLICYLCITFIGAVVLWLFTRNICEVWIEVIGVRVENTYYYHSDMWGRLITSKNEKYRLILHILSFLYNYSLFIYMFAAYVIAGKIFFGKKLRPALENISDTLNALNAGDYSRETAYRSEDEIGNLSQGMEELRKKLILEKRRQWEKQEEQRNINAAFAHDIRTPLTVIRGYTEFLQKYVPKGKVSEELLMEKLETMQYQEERLLRFSNTMNQLQKSEKREISCQWIKLSELVLHIEKMAEAMEQEAGKTISVQWKEEQEIFADSECIQEVVENLLSNALRYTKEQILIQIEVKKSELMIYVKDDGSGFSPKALRAAAEVYFSEEKEGNEHFGIGLSVCKILCENHNGGLTLRNSIEGGAITAAIFGIGRKM